ncbi:MAG: NifU family protein [Candidatus Omnitrophica bacterium]|nr:NifU family protein [Candidatus Omnitrophota bacterium]
MDLKEKVEKAIEDVRCFLQLEGGDCEIVEAKDGIVKVKLVGSCGSCPFSQITLKMRIEAIIKDRVPEVKEVVEVEE